MSSLAHSGAATGFVRIRVRGQVFDQLPPIFVTGRGDDPTHTGVPNTDDWGATHWISAEEPDGVDHLVHHRTFWSAGDWWFHLCSNGAELVDQLSDGFSLHLGHGLADTVNNGYACSPAITMHRDAYAPLSHDSSIGSVRISDVARSLAVALDCHPGVAIPRAAR